jgi:DNA-binding response OmpR family regulator
VSQEELLRRVWGEGYPGGIGVVEVTVHRLRRRLEDGRNGPPRILTVRGEGYMLVDPRRFPYPAFRSGSISTSR